MKSGSTILYLQHADSIGGSVISLREVVLDSIRSGYNCIVFCKNETVAGVYRDAGAEAYCGTVATLNHNTSLFYKLTLGDSLRFIKALLRTIKGFAKIYPIVRKTRPDIVHLNGSNLILYALLFKILGIPTVIHVREIIVGGYLGLRKRVLRSLFNLFPSYVIYISESEWQVLGTKASKSEVIYNYVHESAFVLTGASSISHRSFNELRVVTLGGLFALKGGAIILESLRYTSAVKLLVLGGEDPRIHAAELVQRDGESYAANILRLLADNAIAEKVEFVGKMNNPARFIVDSDAVLFWATSPHFPRPVFEAWLLRKPVIYFNPQFANRYITPDTVFEVEDGSPRQLSEAYGRLRAMQAQLSDGLEHTYQIAVDNFTEKNFVKIDHIYQRCLMK